MIHTNQSIDCSGLQCGRNGHGGCEGDRQDGEDLHDGFDLVESIVESSGFNSSISVQSSSSYISAEISIFCLQGPRVLLRRNPAISLLFRRYAE